MKLSNALDVEKARTDKDSWNKVYLHRDGKFYHIYDWSAWLVKTIVCTEEFQQERGDAKMLLAQMYNTKNASYVIIGFPIESLSKYIPQYENVTPTEDGDILLEVELPYDYDTTTYEDLEADYQAWRDSCPIKENKKPNKYDSRNDSNTSFLASSGLFSIVSRILSYPIEKSTPAENIEFISNIKQQIVKML